MPSEMRQAVKPRTHLNKAGDGLVMEGPTDADQRALVSPEGPPADSTASRIGVCVQRCGWKMESEVADLKVGHGSRGETHGTIGWTET